jgi:arabinofuranosyltransferase
VKRRPPRAAARPTPQPAAAESALFPRGADWLRISEPFLLPLLVLIASRVLLWIMIPIAAEDAYITFRYAKNLAIGNGLLYNPGQRVLGFSSPLWTVWNALGWRLTGAPVEWARASALVADALTLVLATGMLCRQVGRAAGWCFAWFFAAWPFFSAVAVSGMETGVMFMLLVLAAVLSERGSLGAGPALAALALVRPEGLVAAAVIALGARARDRAIAAGLAALGIGALWLYFGSPIPNSMLAKASIYGHPGPIASRFWWDWLVPFPLWGAPKVTEGVHLFLLSAILAPAAVMGVPVAWRLRRSAFGLTTFAAVTIWAGYALVGAAFFFWYLLVPLGGIALLVAAGLPRVVRGRAIYLSLAAYIVGIWGIGLQLYVGRAQVELETFGAVASYLAAEARPGEKVMLEPIGLIGFRNPLVVIDEVGLVSPDVARRRASGPGWYTDIVAAERPEWLVVRRGLLTRGAAYAGRWPPVRTLAEVDSLTAHYALVDSVSPQSGDQALLILRRRGL